MAGVDPDGQESSHGRIIRPKLICDQCMQPRIAGMTLKQCGGCKVAWYCSKQCQAAAWPSHKMLCTSRSSNAIPPIYTMLGCATRAELVHKSGVWLQTHRLALTMIANALVELGGGVDPVLNASRIIVFQLGPPQAYDGTPSTAFKIESASFASRDALRGPDDGSVDLMCGSPATMAEVRKVAARVLRDAGADESVLVGMLPIATLLRDAWETSSETSFPLCRPRLAADGATLVDEGAKAALMNLTRMCMDAINAGIVLHKPDDPNKVVPDLGTVVLQRKAWVWKSDVPSAVKTNPSIGTCGIQTLSRGFLGYYDIKGSSPSALDCFATYHRLWPYYSFSDITKRIYEVYPELDVFGSRR